MQNKLIVLLLLGSSVQGAAPVIKTANVKKAANLSQGLPSLGPPVSEAEEKAVAALPMKPVAPSPPVESIAVPPKAPAIPKVALPKDKAAAKKEEDRLEVAKLGSAAAKLLPESIKEEAKEETSTAPLLGENDQRCYSARFSDLKGASSLTHYATVGVAQGRLGTCAKSLTDYEAQTYLETFPELSQKFGRDTKASWDAARKHYEEVGYLNVHYSAPMKADSKQTTWQCKHNDRCKCHGILWFGAGKRLDDKKDVEKFDDMRLFKTTSKDVAKEAWSACNVAQFGSDPHPGKAKTCFCEDKPLYEPNLCADDGEDCVCSGYVTYGKKLNDKKKVMNFKDHVAGGFALAEVKEGTKSMSCSAEAFGGVNPAGEKEKDAEKACFCDDRKKVFNKDSLKSVTDLWKSKMEVASSTLSITSTTKVLEEVKTEIKTKTEEWTQTIEVQETERKVATEALEAQKKCIVAAKESSKRYKLEQIRKKYTESKRNLELQRQKLAKWKGSIALKHQSAMDSCALSQRAKVPAEKARLLSECNRLKEEVDTQTTDANIETTKVEETEKKETEEETKNTADAEGKGEEEETEVNSTTETKKAEIEEETTETEEQVLTEKVDVAQKKIEILKFQEKTQNQIAAALKKKRQALLKIIKLENERMAQLTREEESTVDVEDGEDDAKATVKGKVSSRAEQTITDCTKRIEQYKTKIVYLVTKISTSTTKVVTLREKVTKLKTTLDTKKAELLETTKTLRSKQEFAEKNPNGTAANVAISELKVEITTIEKLLKTTRTEYVKVYAESLSLQKLIDFFSTQKKEYEDEIKEQEELIEDQKAIVEEQKEKAKVEEKVKAVVKAQNLVFSTHQKVVEMEEELSEAKKTKEEKLAAQNGEKADEDKKLKLQQDELKKLESQKSALEAALKSTTSKPETTRITKEITGITEWITKTTTMITKIEKKITTITTTITETTEKWTTTITELTTKLTALKGDAEKDEEAAAKSVNELPGTPGDTSKLAKEKPATNAFGGKGAGGGDDKATVSGPTAGITDVATTVVTVTEAAKQKRIQCTRATKRLANQKDIISKYIADLKEEIDENKKLVEECKTKLKDEQVEYAKTQADANAISAKDPAKYQELSLKLKALQLALENESKKCNDDEENTEGMFNKIQGKNDEVKELVKFVQEACAEAGQSEEEVASTVGIITQIEVVNRLYSVYIKSVEALGANEKAWDQQMKNYDRERQRIAGLINEIKRRITVAEQTIVTLKTQITTVTSTTTTTTTTTTTVTEQVTKIKMLIKTQEEIVKTETEEQTKTEKLMDDLEGEFKKAKKEVGGLKRSLTRSQETYEDSQKKLRKQVDVKSKIDDYRKKIETGKKTLQQKYKQVSRIMMEIKQEIEANRKKIVALTAQVEDCTKKTTMARTVIATLSSRQSTLEGSKKQLKGADLKKIEAAVEKIDKELDGARNQMTVAETQCSTLKEDISKVTGVVVQYNQEWKYYTTILVTIKKEIDEAEKSAAKGMEEDKEEEDDKKDEKKEEKKEGKEEKKEEGEEKKEEKEEKKPKKEKVQSSSTSNEVKQIETAEETTKSVVDTLEKELEECDASITSTTEESVKITSDIIIDEGEQKDEKAELEKATRRKLRQGCAVKFPAVFTQFSKARSMRSSGMCPCQGGATGTSLITMGIEAPEEADKLVQNLFLKKLASEARFLMQVQRSAVGADNKLVVEGEKEKVTLVISAADDKVVNIISELEEAEITKKGAIIVSPLLSGKKEYMKWVQESLNSVRASASATLQAEPISKEKE